MAAMYHNFNIQTDTGWLFVTAIPVGNLTDFYCYYLAIFGCTAG